MACTLHDIERVCNLPPGGLGSITLIVPDDVDTLPEQFCVPNVADVVLFEGKTVYTIYFKRDSAKLTHKTNLSNPAGDVFEYALLFSLLEIRLSVEWLLAKLANRRVHVIVTYRTGTQRLLLNMRTSSESDSGDRIGSNPQYTVTMSNVLAKPAPLINSSLSGGGGIIETPEPPGFTIGQVIIAPGGTVDIPAEKLLQAIVFTPATGDNAIKVGTTAGGDNIMSDDVAPAGQHYILNTAYYFPTAATLYVAASENCSVIVYLR